MWRKNSRYLEIIFIILLSSYVYASSCDWEIEILSDNIFNNSEEFEFRYRISKIDGDKANITLIRSIEDIYGGIIKSYDNYTQEITTQHTTPYLTPNLDLGVYLIKGEIFPDCEDINLNDNVDSKLVIILPIQLDEDYKKVKINEFFPDPEGEDNAAMPKGEWIELFNEGDKDLDLDRFILEDDFGHEIIISDTNTLSGTLILAKRFLVVYMNGFFGFLNNDGFEKIKFYDNNSNLIDEISYYNSEEGASWSKIDEIWELTLPTPNQENIFIEDITDSYLEIEKVYLGSDNKAKFGDNLRINVNIYKANTSKYSVQLWMEDDNGKEISKRTRFEANRQFINYSLVLPLQIDPNCNEKYEDGNYYVILSGLDKRVEKRIKVEGITTSLCKEIIKEKTKVVEKESKTETNKEIELSENNINDKEGVNNQVTGDIIYQSKEEKQQRLAIYFFSLVLILLVLYFMFGKKM